MKKVAILSLHLGYGGIEKCVVNLANTLCQRYEVELAVCYQLYEKSAFSLDPRVKIHYLNGKLKPNHAELREAIQKKNIFRIIKECFFTLKVLYHRKKTMVEYIKQTDANVIISTRDIFNYWVSGYAKDNVLKIGWEHNHFHDNYRYAHNVRNSAKKLDYLVLVSDALQKFYSKELSHTSCMSVMIPNSIESLPEKVAPLKEKRIISVGRLSKEKGFLDLLEIFRKISLKHNDWSLDIVGDGAEKQKLEEFIQQNSLSDKVTLHGFLGTEEINSLLHRSSIYLMTSYTESFGIVLIEAMSHGVPCIAFDSAEGAREIICSGENGFLIHNRNHGAMIRKIEDLMKDEKLRIKIGKQARESVHKYTSDVVAQEWFSLIEESDIYE